MNKNYSYDVSSSNVENKNLNKIDNSITLFTLLKWTSISILFLYILSLHSSYIEKKNKQEIYKLCKEKHNLPKIFIALLNDGGDDALNDCLFNIFENAACPFRINVTVYKVMSGKYYKNKNNIALSYKSFAEKKSKSGLTFESQISYLNRNEEDDGPYGAILEAFKYNYDNEDYVMTLSDFIHPLLHWDKILCSYSSSHLKSKNVFIISNHNNVNMFSYISGFCKHTRIPLIDLKKCNSKYLKSKSVVSCKFWVSECTFSPSVFWKTIQKPTIKNLHFGSDFLLTCMALQHGFTLIHPHIFITSKKNNAISEWYNEKNFTKDYYKIMINSSFIALREIKNNYKKALQILDMEEGKIASSALLGVVNAKNSDEVLFKYGSVADFYYLFNKYQKL
jgi:hypothetical protein